MKPVFTAVILVAIFTSNDGWTQGHHDATGEASVTIERSSEYEVESKTFEKHIPVKLEYGAGGCKVELRLEYYQKGADAHVKTMLSNEACGASSGNYTIRIRYKDAQGELGLTEFEEAWNRDDDGMVVNEKEYFVGDDVDIVRVNSRRLSCSCTESHSTDEEPDSGEPQH
jgi:hypothetical protein